jgi:hypothetical protein
LDEIYLENLEDFADHILRFKYSIFDLIIRCCNAILIDTRNIRLYDETAKPILLPMFSYRHMLYLMMHSKYKKEMLRLYGIQNHYDNSKLKNN